MARRIEISRRAQQDIALANRWNIEEAPDFAPLWRAGLERALESLQENAGRCPVARESRELGCELRHLLYGKGRTMYRIFFEIREDEVHTIHLRHTSRTPPDFGTHDEPA